MTNILIFGTGDIAEIANYLFNRIPDHNVIAFTVDKKHIRFKQFLGLPLVEFHTIEKNYPPSKYLIFIGIGYSGRNTLRQKKYKEALEKGYRCFTYISDRAHVAENVKIGENCFILDNTVLEPFVEIGNNTIIWSNCIISHHTKIDDHCFLAPGVAVSGRCQIRENCFLGINSTVRNLITIERRCIIGAGSLIMNDTKEAEVYLANPALPSIIKNNKA